MRQANNKVYVEGILNEIDLRYGSFEKAGKTVESIQGNIKILVEPENGEKMIVPIHMFASKYKNDGGLNPAYESIETVMNTYVSIASCGSKEKADKVRVSRGAIKMNDYFKNGVFHSEPRISSSFVNKVEKNFNPRATFSLEFMVHSMEYLLDEDGVEVEPKVLKVKAVVPQYGGKVDVVELTVNNPNVISAVEEYWNTNETNWCDGKIDFRAVTVSGGGFGETHGRTKYINDLVIVGGSEEPMESDFAFSVEEINDALRDRKARLAASKNAEPARTKTPAPTSTQVMEDLGF